MTLHTYFQEHRKQLIQTISELLINRKETYKDLPTYREAIDLILTCVADGKLIRGLLIILAYELDGKKAPKEIYQVAAVMELIHTFLLIHDDIMDNELLRRGKDTVYATYLKQGEQMRVQDVRLYAQSLAICLGDITMFIGFDVLAKLPIDPDKLITVFKLFTTELQHVGCAQIDDVRYGQSDLEPAREKIMQIYTYKTARYTFSLPLYIGGYLGNISDTILNHLDAFGESLGVIFQMKDDELGFLGDEQTLGKSIGSDISENKKTLLRHILYQSLTSKEKQRVDKIFGTRPIDSADLRYLIEIYKQKKIGNILQHIVVQKMNTLQQIQKEMTLTDEKDALLDELIQYNLIRQS